MSQANTENRQAGLGHLPNYRNRVGHGCRISGTVGQENTVGLEVLNPLRGSARWDDRNPTPFLDEDAENVLLNSEIERDHVMRKKRSIENSTYYDNAQKNRMLQDLNIKIQDLDDDMNRKGYKLEEIQSKNDGYQYAGYIQRSEQ